MLRVAVECRALVLIAGPEGEALGHMAPPLEALGWELEG